MSKRRAETPQNNARDTTRPPTKKKRVEPTTRPTPVSLGERELHLIRYLYNLDGELFNRRQYCRKFNLPRTSIKDALDRLVDKGLVTTKGIGVFYISTTGIAYVEQTKGSKKGVGSVRLGGRKGGRDVFSTHDSKFVLKNINIKNFQKDRIHTLHPKEIRKVRLRNMEQTILYFSGVTVIISLKTAVIYVHDIRSHDVDANHLKIVDKAFEYVKKLHTIGVEGSDLILEEAHYAHIQSFLAEFLTKEGKGYQVDLGDGCKFWVDFSPLDGKPSKEDETNDMMMRKRLDEFMVDLRDSESLLSDVDQIKDVDLKYLAEISRNLVIIQSRQLIPQGVEGVGQPKRPGDHPPGKIDKSDLSYFG